VTRATRWRPIAGAATSPTGGVPAGAAAADARSAPGPGWQRLALGAGAAMQLGVVLLNIPDNGLVDLAEHRVPAMIFSHAAAGLLLWGLAPRLRPGIERLRALSATQRLAVVAVAVAVPLGVMAALSVAWPRYAHQLLTREWGLVEPAQFALYLTCAWLAFTTAGLEPPRSREHRLFRLAGWAGVVLALEEIDYLGIVSAVARLVGVPRGRIGGVHVGGLHDVLNLGSHRSAVLPVVVLGLGLAIVLGWAVARGLGPALVREASSATALPLLGTIAFMTVAQLTDIDDRPLAPILDRLGARSSAIGRLREEPAELLAVICLTASLALKLAARLDKPHGDR
jgi:hypothetical protein